MDVRRAVGKGVGYGEVGGRIVTKRRRASASSTRAEALERDERASVIKECKAEGQGVQKIGLAGRVFRETFG
jgi:hypothetical protein